MRPSAETRDTGGTWQNATYDDYNYQYQWTKTWQGQGEPAASSSATNHVTDLENGSAGYWWRHTYPVEEGTQTDEDSSSGPWNNSYDTTVTYPGFSAGAYYGIDQGGGREEYFNYLGDAFSDYPGSASGMFPFAFSDEELLLGQQQGRSRQGIPLEAYVKSPEMAQGSPLDTGRVLADSSGHRVQAASSRPQCRLDLHGHGGPHIQLGTERWSAITLEPLWHLGHKPAPLTERQLREPAKSGVLQEIAKKLPESIVRQAADEVLKEAVRLGGKRAIRKLAEAVLRKMPVVVIIFAGADYAEGGWEKAAKNAVIPGELIEAVAAMARDLYDQWFAEQQARLYEKRFGIIRGWLPEVP